MIIFPPHPSPPTLHHVTYLSSSLLPSLCTLLLPVLHSFSHLTCDPFMLCAILQIVFLVSSNCNKKKISINNDEKLTIVQNNHLLSPLPALLFYSSPVILMPYPSLSSSHFPPSLSFLTPLRFRYLAPGKTVSRPLCCFCL